MGRGQTPAAASAAVAGRREQAPKGMSFDEIVLEFPADEQLIADVRTPNAYEFEDAEQLCTSQAIRCLQAFPELATMIDNSSEGGWDYRAVVTAIVDAAGPDVLPVAHSSEDERDFHITEAVSKLNRKKQATLAEAIGYTLGYQTMQQLDADPSILLRIGDALDSTRRPDFSEVVANWHDLRTGDRAQDLDRAVALRLLKHPYEGEFHAYRRWYIGAPNLVASPEETVPGMKEAGEALAEAIKRGEKIAVFCDYDVDGTTSGEVFRRGLAGYGPDLHYGYADAHAGFGLTEKFVRDAHAAGAKVLVTLDCGSGQTDKVALAQELGMQVIVADHHDTDASNTADFHLNPKLYEVPPSENTGAQLSWKLAAAVQEATEGHTRPEHWEQTMYLAGVGALADMGPVALPENRAFFWHPHNDTVPGVEALATALGEDPTDPNSTVLTRAVMNLPKRTPKVPAATVGQLLAAESVEEAQPIVEKLLGAYEAAKPVKDEMTQKAVAQSGEAVWKDDGTVERPQPDKYFASAVLDDYADYAGYTGTIAPKLSKTTSKPAIVLANKGEDPTGAEIYRFSSRRESGAKLEIGKLLGDEQMQELCTVPKLTEHGEVKPGVSLGGHARSNVVSGSCTKENLPKLLDYLESWAAEEEKQAKKDRKTFWPLPWDGPDAYVSERLLEPERLAAVERQAAKIGPFSKDRESLVAPRRKDRDPKTGSNMPLQVTMKASIELGGVDPESERFRIGELVFSNGERRECRFPADVEPPKGDAEWVMEMKPGVYWLRKFFPLNS